MLAGRKLTPGPRNNAPGVYLTISSLDPAFNRGPAFNREKTVPLLFPPLLALLAAILDLRVTTTPILPFGACYVIMRKVYSVDIPGIFHVG